MTSSDHRANARIVVLGAGVQGTVYGARLADAGHRVTLVARAARAAELRDRGAIIEDMVGGKKLAVQLPVVNAIDPNLRADLCLVTVRREHLADVLPMLRAAQGISRFVIMVNHACGSDFIRDALGRERVAIAFPGIAGGLEDGVIRYVEVGEQPTAVEATARDVSDLFKSAGFRVSLVDNMDDWLRRHAVFVTAVGGALYRAGLDAARLSADRALVRQFVRAVRQAWVAMDRRGVAPAPLALRTIFQWVPLPLSALYWRRFFASPKADAYFVRHTRHSAREMAALAADVRAFLGADTPDALQRLYAAIDSAAARS